jgi:hypothetical protein
MSEHSSITKNDAQTLVTAITKLSTHPGKEVHHGIQAA